jgi:hypothetical protein
MDEFTQLDLHINQNSIEEEKERHTDNDQSFTPDFLKSDKQPDNFFSGRKRKRS